MRVGSEDMASVTVGEGTSPHAVACKAPKQKCQILSKVALLGSVLEKKPGDMATWSLGTGTTPKRAFDRNIFAAK